jgi:hypothetical protein
MPDPADKSQPLYYDRLRPLLASGDVDRVAGLCLSLLFELAELSERVAKLEGADPAKANERIAALVERAVGRK